MKKFLGSLLTLLFVGSTVTPTVSCNKDKTNNKVLEPIKKHEITKNNLDEFFKIHNTFEYKGEFFFKENEKLDEIEGLNSGIGWDIFSYIIDQTFGDLFRKYFKYVPNEYFFQILDLSKYEGIQFDRNNNFNFDIKIISAINNIKYTTEKKVNLNFIETKKYGDEEWIKKYLQYLIELGNSIWKKKYEFYKGHFPGEPDVDLNKVNNKKSYLSDDDAEVLEYISKAYTDIFSGDKEGVLQWFYNEKRIRVRANKYEYLGETPHSYAPGGGVRAKVHLLFEYFNDSRITAESDVEIWMKFTGVDLGEDKLW